MKSASSIFVVALTVTALSLSACQESESADTAKIGEAEAAAGAGDVIPATGSAKNAGSTAPSGAVGTNWFGGQIYSGAPELHVTAALIKAGGGVDHFSFSTALVSMLGQETVDAEVAKLTKQYGVNEVKGFIDGMTFAVNSAIKHVTAAGIELPDAPANLNGAALAKALVKAGTAPDGTFWSGYLFDRTLSNEIHVLVMVDIEKAVGHEADKSAHKILNQAMYDVAQALGMKDVELAPLH